MAWLLSKVWKAAVVAIVKEIVPEVWNPLKLLTLGRMCVMKQCPNVEAPVCIVDLCGHATNIFALAPLSLRCARFHARALRVLLGYCSAKARCMLCRSDKSAKAIWNTQHHRGAAIVRTAALDLKGFYVKAAQALAAKKDLLPEAYSAALNDLLDNCPPERPRLVRQTVDAELRMPLRDAFAQFDFKPLASATIAQVHKAVVAVDGTEVAVKVQHARSETLMANDMGTLISLLQVLSRFGWQANVDLVGVLREYRNQVPGEFDFNEECSALAAVHSSLAPEFPMHVPKPLTELSSRRMLTMEMLKGTSMSSLMQRQANWPTVLYGQSERERVESVLTKLCEGYGRMIFHGACVHGDCHSGNVLIHDETGLPCLLDFGLHRWLTQSELVPLARLTIALADESPPATLQGLRECGVVLYNSPPLLACTAAHLVFDTRMDMEEAKFAPWSEDAVEFRSAWLKIPEELFLVARAIALIRGMLTAADGANVHSARIWAVYAREYLKRVGCEDIDTENHSKCETSQSSASEVMDDSSSAASNAPADLYERMRNLGLWCKEKAFPCSRAALTPLALNNITTLHEALAADEATFNKSFRHFSEEEKRRFLDEARKAVGSESGVETPQTQSLLADEKDTCSTSKMESMNGHLGVEEELIDSAALPPVQRSKHLRSRSEPFKRRLRFHSRNAHSSVDGRR